MPDTEAIDADSAFARLEKLVAMLPQIQRRDTLLLRAREARNLLEIDARTRMLQNEIAGYERVLNQALLDAKAASETGDADGESRQLSIVRAYNELKYTRLSAMQRSENGLREALKASELTLEDPLAEYALGDEDFLALEAEIHDYQEEYQRLYDYCLSLES
ncbi:MAG: hypothetical protein LBU48_07890 [Coriobacteriales bacterium]|jgi:hypothetical protein|nr:hypothetical protein [Coriobacteriales bacterium]